jgi:hypothetical protein
MSAHNQDRFVLPDEPDILAEALEACGVPAAHVEARQLERALKLRGYEVAPIKQA